MVKDLTNSESDSTPTDASKKHPDPVSGNRGGMGRLVARVAIVAGGAATALGIVRYGAWPISKAVHDRIVEQGKNPHSAPDKNDGNPEPDQNKDVPKPPGGGFSR